MISFYVDPVLLSSQLSHFGKDHLIQTVDKWGERAIDAGLLTKPVLFALALYGECRGEPPEDDYGVAAVMFNRTLMRAKVYIENTLLQPFQFSCFNKGDKSLVDAVKATPKVIDEWLEKADDWLKLANVGHFPNPVEDATLYCTDKALQNMAVRWGAGQSSAWDFHKLIPRGRLGDHFFFAEG